MDGLKVVAFDTGGTILDWHGGITAALAECGRRRDIGRDWHELANEYRRRALRRMLGAVDPRFNIDDVHREVLDELLGEAGIAGFSDADRQTFRPAGTRSTPGRILRLRWCACGSAMSACRLRFSAWRWSLTYRAATQSIGTR